MKATEVPRTAADLSASSGEDSRRVAEARTRAYLRLGRQRSTLRPLGWAVMLVVAAATTGAHPAPSGHGAGLGVTLALCAFLVTMWLAIRDRFPERGDAMQVAVISAMGAAGVALAALQVRGATELAASAAVWMAVTRFPLAPGVALGTALTVALGVATALAGSSQAAVFAGTLLCALLGLTAYFVKQARASQDRTEVLLALLEDAREEQTRAAAIAERGRIAGELHDVLAHSLSGAAIQLQGARKLAERDGAHPQVRAAIDRASELIKGGLESARQAVGALRGDELPTVAQLDSLVQSFRDDMGLDVTLTVRGRPHPLSAQAGLALYRGAQEALTNVARHASGASTRVVLSYGADRTTLSIENHRPSCPPDPGSAGGLAEVGGGRGLSGMRERLEGLGGGARAGPTEVGWRVELELPA